MPRDSVAPEFVDVDAERAVLGCVLLDEGQAAGTLARVSQHVRCARKTRGGVESVEGDFAHPGHNTIFLAMVDVVARGESLDVVTLCAELRRVDRLNSIGGAQYVGELTDAIPTMAHCEDHARLVRREADRRRVDASLAKARRDLRSCGDPDAALALTLETVRTGVEAGSVTGGPRGFDEHAMEAWSRIERAANGSVCKMVFGIPRLDELTGGIAEGQVVTIAGMQGRGKTALLAQLIEENGRRFNAHADAMGEEPARILWWSLEMGGPEMLIRHAAWDCDIPQASIRDGRLSNDQAAAVSASFNERSRLPVDFDGHSDPTVVDIRSHVYACPSARLVAVDWLGLLARHPDAPHGAKPHELASLNMKTLKTLARRRHVAVVVLNQFTQEGNREGKPSMHHMLGGASVVNDSDTVILMHADDDFTKLTMPVDIIVPKSRSSRTGRVETIFQRDRGTIRELAVTREDTPTQPVDEVEAPFSRHADRIAKVLPFDHRARAAGDNSHE